VSRPSVGTVARLDSVGFAVVDTQHARVHGSPCTQLIGRHEATFGKMRFGFETTGSALRLSTQLFGAMVAGLGCKVAHDRRKRKQDRLIRRTMNDRCAPEGEAGLLAVAERYSSDDWWLHVLDVPYSKILRRISLQLTFITAISVLVEMFQEQTGSVVPLPVTPLTLSSAALGLLLVFRTSSAFERWQLGQRHTYTLRHHLQQLLRTIRPWISGETFVGIQALVCAFPQIIEVHLKARPGAGFIYGIGPRDLMTQVSEELVPLFSSSEVSTAALYAHDRAQGHINEILLIVSDMERLTLEAIPRDYSRHTSRFLTVWMCSLPFVLLECGKLMPVAVALVAWALLSIEEIGHTLEDPFNSPTQPVQVRNILEAGSGQYSLSSGMSAKFPPTPPLLERQSQGEET